MATGDEKTGVKFLDGFQGTQYGGELGFLGGATLATIAVMQTDPKLRIFSTLVAEGVAFGFPLLEAADDREGLTGLETSAAIGGAVAGYVAGETLVSTVTSVAIRVAGGAAVGAVATLTAPAALVVGVMGIAVGAVVSLGVENIITSLFSGDGNDDPCTTPASGSGIIPGYNGTLGPTLENLTGGVGLCIPTGHEFNKLDEISEFSYIMGKPQRAPEPATASDSIRRVGEAIDDILDRGGALPGSVGNVIKASANAIAGAVDGVVNVFQNAQDAAAAAYQREYNRDRQDSGGGRPRGDSAADRAADRAAAERAGSGGGGSDSGRVNGGDSLSGGQSSTVTGRTTSQTTYTSGGQTHTATHVTGGGGGGADSGRAANPRPDRTATEGRRPILLDLDGDGVKITEYQNSTQFMTGKDGFQHRSSWAGAGDGVLFYDPDGRNAITEHRQYVFTEWNPTAAG